jgi:hypothetical protein
VLPGQGAQSLQESRTRREQSGVPRRRLDNRCRQLAGVSPKHRFQRLQVIIGNGERQFGQGARHAGAIRQAQRRHARPGLHQELVGVPMVAALKLEHLVAASGGPRHAQRGHGGFRA